MAKSHDLFRFVANAIEPYHSQDCLFSTLTAFWAGSLLAYIEKMNVLQPQDMAILLPVIMQGIKSDNRDLRMGSYIILSHLATRTDLSQESASLFAETILVSFRRFPDFEDQEAALTTLAILCAQQDPPLPPFSAKAAAMPLSSFRLLADMAQKSDISALLQPLLSTFLKIAEDQPVLANQLYEIMAPPTCPVQITQVAIRIILDLAAARKTIPGSFTHLLSAVEQRLPGEVSLLSFASDPSNGRIVHLLQKVRLRHLPALSCSRA